MTIVVDNPLGQDPVDFNEETAAARVGARIREIRETRGMSQADVGALVGLTADRIQKYENGVRRPKLGLLKQIAAALGVEPAALTDPVVGNAIGAMYALFEMERLYGLSAVQEDDDWFMVHFSDANMTEYMTRWVKRHDQLKSDLALAVSDEDRESLLDGYKQWEWTFPLPLVSQTKEELRAQRKKQLEETIRKAQRELEELNASEM